MLDSLHLKDRENFLKLYLTPAIDGGFVKMLYPDSPRHPRQKYLLTGKGQMLLSSLKENLQTMKGVQPNIYPSKPPQPIITYIRQQKQKRYFNTFFAKNFFFQHWQMFNYVFVYLD